MYMYLIFCKPIEMLIEIIFMIIYRLTHRPELCIIGVSLAVNLLVLPIYNRADAVQEEERKKQKEMSHWVEHIKKAFKGDERMMMLQTYYRQQNYKPIYAVRSSISVLLQIPFFIAAYHFLSNLDLLFHASCGPISDLSAPDGLIKIFGISINLLPVLMTVINIFSGLIYSKGLSVKEVIQIPVLALVFLVLLYNSPSGLVLYWTLNNIFSLFKNVFKKYIKNSGFILSIMVSLAGFAGAFLVLRRYWNVADKFRILGIGLIILTSAPLAINLLTRSSAFKKDKVVAGKYDNKLNFIAGIMIVVLMGLLIPSSVIKPSPTEFYDYSYFVHPFHYVLSASLLALGFFVVWESVFYYLADLRTRSAMAKVMLIAGFCFVADFMLFGNHLGNISADMVFDDIPAYSAFDSAKNIFVLAIVAVGVLLISKKKELLWNLSIITTVSLLALSGVNLINISKQVSEDRAIHTTSDSEEIAAQNNAGNELFFLSTNADNTVIIMLDRAVSGYIPYMIEERPELKQQFEDFVYYPNTVSLGGGTVISTPSLFGGYEYTPESMITDNGQTFAEKQNEALSVLPVLFDKNGYDVTVCDPPFAGLRWIPDLSIYDDYPEINAYITKGSYSQMYTKEDPETNVRRRERSMFCYSLFKCIPVGIQTVFYDSGFYWSSDSGNAAFINQYSTLCCLPEITGISDKSTGTFFIIDNDTTHEPCELQLPDYTPERHIDNSGLETGSRTLSDGSSFSIDARYHYHVNMAAVLRLGEWLEYLKVSGVYDNTRIIIVSDHGAALGQFDELLFDVAGESFDAEKYNPLLMYKDINVTEIHSDLVISDDFRTLADVPALAAIGMVTDPVNPFTGNALHELNGNEEVSVCISGGWTSDDGDLTIPTGDTVLYTVHDSIFDPDNWGRESGE